MNLKGISIFLCASFASYLKTLKNMHFPCNVIKNEINKEILPILNSVNYIYIFNTVQSQHQITKVFQSVIQLRERLRVSSLDPAYPGLSTGPGG